MEDCPSTSVAELESLFGKDVADIVAELTDDKSLPKADRKKLQIINAAKKSKEACLVKLAELNAYDDLGSVRQAQNAAISTLERKAKRAGADEAQIRKFMLSFMQGAL